MATSYKPALLKALVRLVRQGVGPEIPLQAIGHEFVAMYWMQTVVFRLRQDFTLSKESEVVRSIREVAEVTGVRNLANLSSEARSRLDRKMARILPINVLGLFHASKPASMGELYDWTRGENAVHLPVAAHHFIDDNAPTLESIANLWWARFLERRNGLAPLVIEKVERDGVRRERLTAYVRLLQRLDGNRCFYCERDLAANLATHVDHVIPWSFLLSNPSWDLVLACGACNLAKSDRLPTESFMQKLALTNAARRRAELPRTFASALLIQDDEIERYYAAAISVEWPAGWTPSTLR